MYPISEFGCDEIIYFLFLYICTFVFVISSLLSFDVILKVFFFRYFNSFSVSNRTQHTINHNMKLLPEKV